MLKYVVISLILGGIAVFSYAPFHQWFLSFISFAGLLWLIANKSKKQATLLGLTWGIGYFASGVHWIYISIKQYGELPTPLAIIILALLVAYLSLYPMLFALILRVVEKKYAPSFSFKQLVITAPIIWQLTEFLRGYIMTGFAWLQLGYSQLDSPLRGYFPVFGIDGVNLITTMACGLIVYLLYRIYFHCLKNQKSGVIHVSKVGLKQSCQRKPIFGAIFALLVIFVAPITLNAISWVQIKPTTIANLVLIQGNIAQSLRWNSQQLNKTLRTYGTLTQDNLDNNIIIWSEASITDYELNQQTFLQDLDNEARAHNAEVAVGIIDYHPKNDYSNDGDVYNTLIVLGQETPYQYPTKNRYQKQHLVPFGEFTPLASILKPIANMLNIPMSSMTPGDTLQKPLEMKGLKFTTVICYEVILSDLVWRNFEPNTDFLLTVSNDAWFGDSIGPWQHLQMAQARALEFGRPLIRSTNNGITAIIDHNGNIINQLPQFETAVLKQTLKATTGLTPYARWGNISYYTALCLMLIFLFFKRHQKY